MILNRWIDEQCRDEARVGSVHCLLDSQGRRSMPAARVGEQERHGNRGRTGFGSGSQWDSNSLGHGGLHLSKVVP